MHASVFSTSAVFGFGIGQLLNREGFTVSMLATMDVGELLAPAELLVVAPHSGQGIEMADILDQIPLSRPVIVVTSDPGALYGGAAQTSGSRRLVHRDAPIDVYQRLVRHVARGEVFAAEPAGAEPDGEQVVLSGRERQVLRQIASGLTHHQVARRLGISPHTVDTYVRRIRSKLSIGNKADLTRAALSMVS